MTYFVAVTDSPAGGDLTIERSVLAGMRVERVSADDQAGLVGVVSDADAVLCMHTHIDRTVLQALRRCKVIVRFGTGLDNIDLRAAAEAGIPVVGIHDYCTVDVADHTMALLLCWNRKVLDYHRFVETQRWNERTQTTGNWGCGPITRLSDQTLGLLGFGHIGRAVARRARAFGMRVLAYSRNPDPTIAAQLDVELVDRPTVLAAADYISLHLPLSDETRHFINGGTISLMKRGAVVINTARGGLIEEGALAEALRSGRLGGALLDVYQQAPLPIEHPFRSLPNVIFSAHVGFYSEQSLADLRRLAAEAVSVHLP